VTDTSPAVRGRRDSVVPRRGNDGGVAGWRTVGPGPRRGRGPCVDVPEVSGIGRGDGPERNSLEQLVKTLGIEKNVVFCGWVSHAETLKRLRSSDVLVFPSVRDFGGGVVFEALACGAVPVVADFGGPGDIVYPEVGFKAPVTNESDLVLHLENALTELAHKRDHLERLRRQGMIYARERLSWNGKAQDTTRVLDWVLRHGPKPDLLPPKGLAPNFVLPRKNAASSVGSPV